jgi:hypothetical protein
LFAVGIVAVGFLAVPMTTTGARLRRVSSIWIEALPGRHFGDDRLGDRADQIGRHVDRIHLFENSWISRTVSPRAHNAMILSSKPVKRRSCLPISWGSKVPLRSRPKVRHVLAGLRSSTSFR